MAKLPKGVTFTVKLAKAHERVLTPDALNFVASLHRRFEAERRTLLARRAVRQKAFDAGLKAGGAGISQMPSLVTMPKFDWVKMPSRLGP